MSNPSENEKAIGFEALERILEVTRRLAAPFDLNTMLAQVLDAAKAVLDAERGTVFLYESETDQLVSTVATGLDELRLPADRGIAGECAQTRMTVNVPDCYADPRFDPKSDKATGYRTRCLLSLPLIGYDSSLVGVLQLLNKNGGVFDTHDERIASTLAAQCAVALQRVRMTEQLVIKERFDRELAVAREIQTGFLPTIMPGLRGYDMAGLSRPADETGGDTFDLVPVGDDRVMLLLGDATGHGIGPALSVTQVRAMLRVALRLGADLNSAFSHINDQLVEDLADHRFVTAFLGLLDATRHRVEYHAGGQGPLLHFRAATSDCDWHGATTAPMGFMAHLTLQDPQSIDLAPGDILGLITDGLFEYENTAGGPFGEQNVAQVIRENHTRPMSELCERLLDRVHDFGRGVLQADDITIVLVRRLPV